MRQPVTADCIIFCNPIVNTVGPSNKDEVLLKTKGPKISMLYSFLVFLHFQDKLSVCSVFRESDSPSAVTLVLHQDTVQGIYM